MKCHNKGRLGAFQIKSQIPLIREQNDIPWVHIEAPPPSPSVEALPFLKLSWTEWRKIHTPFLKVAGMEGLGLSSGPQTLTIGSTARPYIIPTGG